MGKRLEESYKLHGSAEKPAPRYRHGWIPINPAEILGLKKKAKKKVAESKEKPPMVTRSTAHLRPPPYERRSEERPSPDRRVNKGRQIAAGTLWEELAREAVKHREIGR